MLLNLSGLSSLICVVGSREDHRGDMCKTFHVITSLWQEPNGQQFLPSPSQITTAPVPMSAGGREEEGLSRE